MTGKVKPRPRGIRNAGVAIDLATPALLERVSDVVFVGIDPGASGGLAWLRGEDAGAVPMPDSPVAVWSWLKDTNTGSRRKTVAVIEKVGGYIKASSDGHGGNQPGSAMFEFGRSFGGLESLLAVAMTEWNWCYSPVMPQTWQNAMGIDPRDKVKEKQPAFKRRLKEIAARLFPRLTPTLATADALILAEYARQRYIISGGE